MDWVPDSKQALLVQEATRVLDAMKKGRARPLRCADGTLETVFADEGTDGCTSVMKFYKLSDDVCTQLLDSSLKEAPNLPFEPSPS